MAPYRVDRPSEDTRQMLVPFVVFGMVVVALPILASLLWVGYLLWWIAFPPLYSSFADVQLLLSAPIVLVVWGVGGLLLWWLRSVLRGLLD